MSARETNVREACGLGKDIRDGAQPLVDGVHPAPALLPPSALAQLRRAGVTLPRPSAPGTEWTPRTDAERHLLRECHRLDRIRQMLLAEVGRLRQSLGQAPQRERVAAAARTAGRLSACPLTTGQLSVLAAAAAGESPEDTARRLVVTYDTVRSQRQRAVHRLGARSVTHAVALAVAAGWITREQVTGGVTP